MPSIHVNGVDLFYEELGSGDEIVLCTQVSHAKYELERELARRGFHVYLLTNRGFGRSTHVTEDYGEYWYERFAEDVLSFADAMNISQFIYSGASHGAGSGWHVVLRAPNRVKCFFAVVPGPHNLDEGTMSYRKMQMLGIQREPPVFRYPTQDPRITQRWNDEDRFQALRKAQTDYKSIYESEETNAIEYGRPLRPLKNEANLIDHLKKIKTPVLILGGMEDNISRPDLMIRSAKALPNCKLVIYSGFGHDLPICEELAEECVRFYQNVKNSGYYYEPLSPSVPDPDIL